MHGYTQKRLPLDTQSVLESLWEGFPQASREAVIEHYAGLIAAAVRGETTANDGETEYDQNSDG